MILERKAKNGKWKAKFMSEINELLISKTYLAFETNA